MTTDLPFDPSDFQTTVDGQQTDLYILDSGTGITAAITNYGARIAGIWMPDRRGNTANIVAGYRTISGYLEHDELYLGATVGRYANRIDGARFDLHGKTFELPANEGSNQLHGGEQAFHNAVWQKEYHDEQKLILSHHSPDGESGFPGNLDIQVRFELSSRGRLRIVYRATSDADTILNVTNHAYFNLSGEGADGDVHAHHLQINADRFTPVGPDLLPTGELEAVEGTPFDFRNSRPIGRDIGQDNLQLKRGGGYDHNFVLNKTRLDAYTTAASVTDPGSGRRLEVKTTEPGVQFYECRFSSNADLNLPSAFCLETQHFPDSPNQLHFPSVLLKKGDQFYSKTAYILSVEKGQGT